MQQVCKISKWLQTISTFWLKNYLFVLSQFSEYHQVVAVIHVGVMQLEKNNQVWYQIYFWQFRLAHNLKNYFVK